MTSPRDESHTGINRISASPSRSNQRVLVVFGTRPEAIKLCPLIAALRSDGAAGHLETVVCVTGQHRKMLDQVLQVFDVAPDYDLNVMQAGQTLSELTARLLTALAPVLAEVRPSLVILQGDTTTTLCGALAAFYAQIPVAHVEAGMRTFDLGAPFPEEMNRMIATRLASLHFAATGWAADNLVREGVPQDAIEITGNTGIDAVLTICDAIEQGRASGLSVPLAGDRKLIVVTAHRRESFGEPFARICAAVAALAKRPDVQIV